MEPLPREAEEVTSFYTSYSEPMLMVLIHCFSGNEDRFVHINWSLGG